MLEKISTRAPVARITGPEFNLVKKAHQAFLRPWYLLELKTITVFLRLTRKTVIEIGLRARYKIIKME
jgi:hypothetical protein